MTTRTHNYRPELDDLTDAQRQAVLAGADALNTYREFNRKSFDLWLEIARGVRALRHLADQRSAPGSFKRLLRDNGYASLNTSTASRLLLMARHETAIRVWRDALTPLKRERWNSPTSICSRCPTIKAVMAEQRAGKPARGRKVGSSNNARALELTLDDLQDKLGKLDLDGRKSVVERIYSQALGQELESARAKALADTPAAVVDQILMAFDKADAHKVAFQIWKALGFPSFPKAKKGGKPDEPQPTPRKAKGAKAPELEFDSIPVRQNGSDGFEAGTKDGKHVFRVQVNDDDVWAAMLMPDGEVIEPHLFNRQQAEAACWNYYNRHPRLWS